MACREVQGEERQRGPFVGSRRSRSNWGRFVGGESESNCRLMEREKGRHYFKVMEINQLGGGVMEGGSEYLYIHGKGEGAQLWVHEI